jgi:chromosome segregation ATPase
MTTPENAKQPKVGEFRIELWGYERRSVDALVAELMHRLSEAEPAALTPGQVEVEALRRRVAELEAGAPAQADTLSEAGAEAGRLLVEIAKLAEGVQRRARELAHQTVANAEAEAAALLEAARGQAQEREQAAERALAEAERIRGEAEHEARLAAERAVEQARAEAEQQAGALRADIDRLVEVRDRLAADLARVRGQVETLLGNPGDPGEVARLETLRDRRVARRPAQADRQG